MKKGEKGSGKGKMGYKSKEGRESRKTDGGRDYGRKEGMGSRKMDGGRDYGRKEGRRNDIRREESGKSRER